MIDTQAAVDDERICRLYEVIENVPPVSTKVDNDCQLTCTWSNDVALPSVGAGIFAGTDKT
jgi:hypothetical protein